MEPAPLSQVVLSPFVYAARRLAARHAAVRMVRRHAGDPLLDPRSPSVFHSLARAIVYQQLAAAAARTIWGRVLAVSGTPLTKHKLDRCTDDRLRSAGLSAAKLAALRDLARLEPALNLRGLYRCADEVIIDRLTQVRGIGRWTAEMFLIFHLERLDVWPCGDLGVREGLRRVLRLSERPTEKQMPILGEAFAPYRSVAAWYMWRALELPPQAFERLK